jgi:hypothetical protein
MKLLATILIKFLFSAENELSNKGELLFVQKFPTTNTIKFFKLYDLEFSTIVMEI